MAWHSMGCKGHHGIFACLGSFVSNTVAAYCKYSKKGMNGGLLPSHPHAITRSMFAVILSPFLFTCSSVWVNSPIRGFSLLLFCLHKSQVLHSLELRILSCGLYAISQPSSLFSPTCLFWPLALGPPKPCLDCRPALASKQHSDSVETVFSC